MYLMHLNDFYEFGSIEPNSKKHRNIEYMLASEHFIPLPRSVTDISFYKIFKNESHMKNTLKNQINF
jgi:hypothetical protein